MLRTGCSVWPSDVKSCKVYQCQPGRRHVGRFYGQTSSKRASFRTNQTLHKQPINLVCLLFFRVYILVPIIGTAVITDSRFIAWALEWVLNMCSTRVLLNVLQYQPLVYPPQDITISPRTLALMREIGEREAKNAAAAQQAAATERIKQSS